MSLFDQLADNFTKLTKDVGSKAQEITETAKLNAKISDANTLIKSTYAAIGESYYNSHKDDENPEMAEQFKIIEEAKKTISEYQSQINSIKGVRICPNCGAEISDKSAFCNKCGTKVEKIVEEKEPIAEKKKCSVCGEPLDDDAAFCTNCGTPVTGDDNASNDQQ